MTGYGMPSSHAQFMGFLVAWSFGFVWFVMARQNETIRTAAMERVRKAREVVFLLGLVGVSALVCYSRSVPIGFIRSWLIRQDGIFSTTRSCRFLLVSPLACSSDLPGYS